MRLTRECHDKYPSTDGAPPAPPPLEWLHEPPPLVVLQPSASTVVDCALRGNHGGVSWLRQDGRPVIQVRIYFIYIYIFYSYCLRNEGIPFFELSFLHFYIVIYTL